MASEVLLVLSTFPDVETARRICCQLVEERCVACASVIPQIESIYWWKGKVERGGETLALLKTTAVRYSNLESRLRELHPYEVPEIMAIPINAGLSEYLTWVSTSCAP